MLSEYLAEQKTVTVTLQNKARVTGRLKAFDSYVLVLDGPKREIIYRHAVSSLALHVVEEARQPAVQKTVPAAPRQKNGPPEKPRPTAAPPLKDQGLNNSMKEGLIRWMQGQKAAK